MWEYEYPEELQHYGVKGMKWGFRRSRELSASDVRGRYNSAKTEYRNAKKAFNKSYNKAFNYSNMHPIGQFVSKKKKAESDRRWDDAVDKADKLNESKQTYKQVKDERKQQIKDTYKKIDKNTSFGERVVYNDATRKKAAKYVVDNNMTMKEANDRAKSDAKRNTAIILAAYGAVTVGTLVAQSRR